MKIEVKSFYELSLDELYEILKLRSEVFVVEQQCLYLDIDDLDRQSEHLLVVENERIIGYIRLMPPGLKYPEASLGRVVLSQTFRHSDIGKTMVLEAMKQSERPIRISAQYYLKSFYEHLGFEQVGELYLEDGIEHIEMLCDE